MTRRRHTPWFEGPKRRSDQEAVSFSFVLEIRKKTMCKSDKELWGFLGFFQSFGKTHLRHCTLSIRS